MTLTMQRKVGRFDHPESFSLFFTDWIRLLQTYVFPKHVVQFDVRRINEAATLREFGKANESVWPTIDMATLTELVQQRYIRTHVLGCTSTEDREFVQDRVKYATDYLRVAVGVSPASVIGLTDLNSFESGLSPDLSSNPFAQRQLRFSAALTLLYQIRCNLFHGVKGFRNSSKRDILLTSIGVRILQDIIHALQRREKEDA